MRDFSELKIAVENLKKRLASLGEIFDLAPKKERLIELGHQAADENLWSDAEKAKLILKEQAELKMQIEQSEKLISSVADLEAFIELAKDEQDLQQELALEIPKLEKLFREFELAKMLCGEHDNFDAILEINAGAGGTDAQDWAEMLLRMYLRWAERRELKAELVQVSAGEEAGIKSATLYVRGEHAFGYLRSERGVHRLVRLSPFKSGDSRQTSFASVSVTPDVDDSIQVEIRDDDLRIDTFRAGGAGGQHINKTDSAVRVTHAPSGIVVSCQTSRSQHQNKATALKLLKAKLYEREYLKKQEEIAKLSGDRKKIDFGSQIRSYVLHPYQMAKDVRTGIEIGDVNSVLDGAIDPFIEGYLLSAEWNMA